MYFNDQEFVASVKRATEAMNALQQAIAAGLEKFTRTVQVRYRGESPAQYVMRIGPKSGHTIHPDEAWRYEADQSWWGQDARDHQADFLFHTDPKIVFMKSKRK